MRMGLDCEKTLGSISPKSNSRKVTTMVLKIKSHVGLSTKSLSMSCVVKITKQMLTMLFATNIVASSLSLLLNRSRTRRDEASDLPSNSSISPRVSEKKATSEPEAIADIASNTNDMILKDMILPTSMQGCSAIIVSI